MLRFASSGGGNTEPLTVRSLGKELGADPTAIYRHFRDKDELVRAVLDKLIGDVVAAVDPEAGWRERLTRARRRVPRRLMTSTPGSALSPGTRPPAGRASSRPSR